MVIGKQSPGLDIAVVALVSALAFLGEMAAADLLPWGDEARGVIAVLTGAAAAVAVTLLRGGTLAELGFRRPRRWATVPLWALAIFVVFVVAQNVGPLLIAYFVDLPQPDMSRYDFVRGTVFVDTALVWDDTVRPFATHESGGLQLNDLHAAYGVGLRVPLRGPFGLVNARVDIAQETNLRENLGKRSIIFSLGNDF